MTRSPSSRKAASGTRSKGRSSTLEAIKGPLRLLEVLAPGEGQTIRALLGALNGEAAITESGIRSAQRQLEVLEELGLAVCKPGGPGLASRYGLSTKASAMGLARHVTVQEWAVLQMAASQLRSLLPLELRQALENALQRLAPGAQGSAEHDRARAWGHKTGFVPTALALQPPHMPPGVMSTCFDALWNDRPLRFRYTKPNGEKSTREVQPLAVVQQGSSHLLVAKELHSGATKHFVLHRMGDVRISSELPLQYPVDFDLQQDELQGKFGFGDGSTVRAVIEIEGESGAHVCETPLSADQSVEELSDGWLRVSATVADNLWFWDWLRGFGTRARLIEPADRARHLRRHPKAKPPQSP